VDEHQDRETNDGTGQIGMTVVHRCPECRAIIGTVQCSFEEFSSGALAQRKPCAECLRVAEIKKASIPGMHLGI
jgi:hypothetical protein